MSAFYWYPYINKNNVDIKREQKRRRNILPLSQWQINMLLVVGQIRLWVARTTGSPTTSTWRKGQIHLMQQRDRGHLQGERWARIQAPSMPFLWSSTKLIQPLCELDPGQGITSIHESLTKPWVMRIPRLIWAQRGESALISDVHWRGGRMAGGHMCQIFTSHSRPNSLKEAGGWGLDFSSH